MSGSRLPATRSSPLWTPRRVVFRLLQERLKRLGKSTSLLSGGEMADGDWLPESRPYEADELDWESLAHLTRGADPLGLMVLEARELLWSDHEYASKTDRHGAVEPGAVAMPPTDEQIAQELGTTVACVVASQARAEASIAENIHRAGLNAKRGPSAHVQA